MANIGNNRQKAKDDERKDRQKHKGEKGRLIKLHKGASSNKNMTNLSEEDLALKFPVYHDILSEDD